MEWITNHYTLEQNPGQGTAGLYYYYNTFGSALSASELDVIATKDGNRDWRRDLRTELAEAQRPDGSWVNANRQWLENDPNLCTAFALLALDYCNKPTVAAERQPN